MFPDLKKDGNRGEFGRESLQQSGLRPPMSVAHSTSYDSLHHFGSEGNLILYYIVRLKSVATYNINIGTIP